jgi:diaminohydroxyphosphoribosylaminopyrimidine deaminase/5-amino-6-(5-phosphoribosylamino)uracil reductase
MNAALALAARGLGDTWPNPSVGCVLVREGRVVGRGWTQSGGRPHAEAEALARAGSAAAGATAYVTLEPCSHHGKTPPCAEALAAAGVTRVVSALRDPDPRVNGGGVARLQAAGVVVEEGLGEAEAAIINRGFFLRVAQKRPLFALKTATSLDGRIALASGISRWITGPAARHAVQVLRARYDAILVGSETVVADDPGLNCRLPDYAGRPKVRVVFDRRLRLPLGSELVRSARISPTWVLSTPEAVAEKGAALTDAGVTVLAVDAARDGVAFAKAAVIELAARGLTRVLVEGGGQLAASFLRADLFDELNWFRAGRVLGGDARPVIADMALDRLPDNSTFRRVESLAFGPDALDLYVRSTTP